MKTRKSLKKRFKLTKTGKILRRPTGQNHYRRKKTGKQKRQKRGWVELSPSLAKKLRKLIK